MSWPTIAECKAYSADVPEVKNAADSVIEGKIEDAIIFIKRHCKQEFDNPEIGVAKYFNGNDSDTLDLYPRCYVITAVLDNSYNITELINLIFGDNFSNLEAEYPASRLEFNPRIRTRVRVGSFDTMFPLGSKNIKVTGNWGWATIPDDIINACKQIVERLIIKRLDIREWMSPFQSERTPDGYSYNKLVNASILDSELANKLNDYIYDLISITRL